MVAVICDILDPERLLTAPGSLEFVSVFHSNIQILCNDRSRTASLTIFTVASFKSDIHTFAYYFRLNV